MTSSTCTHVTYDRLLLPKLLMDWFFPQSANSAQELQAVNSNVGIELHKGKQRRKAEEQGGSKSRKNRASNLAQSECLPELIVGDPIDIVQNPVRSKAPHC